MKIILKKYWVTRVVISVTILIFIINTHIKFINELIQVSSYQNYKKFENEINQQSKSLHSAIINKITMNEKNELEIMINENGKAYKYIVDKSEYSLSDNMEIVYKITENKRIYIVGMSSK